MQCINILNLSMLKLIKVVFHSHFENFNINWIQSITVPLEISFRSVRNCTGDWHFVIVATSFQAPDGKKRYPSAKKNQRSHWKYITKETFNTMRKYVESLDA